MRSWIETRLVLPFIPFAFDLFVRFSLLKAHIEWWEVPDLKTLAITTAFFAFLVALDVRHVRGVPSDPEYYNLIDVMRRRFSLYGIGSTVVFGIATVTDAAERIHTDLSLSDALYPYFLIMTSTVLFAAVLECIVANLKYKFDYAG